MLQRPGQYERTQGGGIDALPAIGNQRHGIDTKGLQALDPLPFVARSQHRPAQLQQVSEDLAPADPGVQLEEITPPGQLHPQGAPPGCFANPLPLLFEQKLEGVTTRRNHSSNFRRQVDHDACVNCSIRSAARCGML